MRNKIAFCFPVRKYTSDIDDYLISFRKNGNPWTVSLKRDKLHFLNVETEYQNTYHLKTTEKAYLKCYLDYIGNRAADIRSLSILSECTQSDPSYLLLASMIDKISGDDFFSIVSRIEKSRASMILAQAYHYGIFTEKNDAKAMSYLDCAEESDITLQVKAEILLERKDYDGVLTILKNSSTSESMLLCGKAYLAKGETRKACQCFYSSRKEEGIFLLSDILKDPELPMRYLSAHKDEKATERKLAFLIRNTSIRKVQEIYQLLDISYPKDFHLNRELKMKKW